MNSEPERIRGPRNPMLARRPAWPAPPSRRLGGRWTRVVVAMMAMLVASAQPSVPHPAPTLSPAVSTTASGYRDVGHDPDDRPMLGDDPDIRRTSRRVYRSNRGRMVLKVKVHAYETLGLFWGMKVFLDSRGGRRPDHVMGIGASDTLTSCSVHPRGHRRQATFGKFWMTGDLTYCRVPLESINPNKRIRWRIVSRSYEPEGGVTERAPNQGWYSVAGGGASLPDSQPRHRGAQAARAEVD